MMWGATGAWVSRSQPRQTHFTADVALDMEHAGGAIQLFANIFTHGL
jgi:hypothetical protein